MLKKFSVSNFKNFSKKVVLDLTAGRYDFNSHCVTNKIVNTAIIYGHNACGKSNFALAIFDIVYSLTDYTNVPDKYKNYQNIFNKNAPAKFEYEFQFNNTSIVYEYEKMGLEEILKERVIIDGEVVIEYDRKSNSQLKVNLKGTQSLEKTINNPNLSAVKYIKANANITKDNPLNTAFLDFLDYVDRMLLFWCLQNRKYVGFESGGKLLIEDLENNNRIDEYNKFLLKMGIDRKISIEKTLDNKFVAYYDFGHDLHLPYDENAMSNGESALLLFFYWLTRLKNDTRHPSLFFIDEFDAFYHIDLAKDIISILSKTQNCQVIVTSHNPSIISNDLLRPDCYYLIENEVISNFQNLTLKDIRKAHNIERMYRAGAFSNEQ